MECDNFDNYLGYDTMNNIEARSARAIKYFETLKEKIDNDK
jgi:hypothetical protein